MNHIDAHLAEPLHLETLASVAHVSPWHFHRVFAAFTRETLAERVRRRRLEVAAGRLLATPPVPALRVALDVGFGSAAVFTRAFRAHFGVTPTAWRQGAFRDWARERRVKLSKIRQADSNEHQAAIAAFFQDAELWPRGRVERGNSPMQVELKTLSDTRVAYLRHIGPYGGPGIARAWQRFVAWCGEHGLTQPRRRMYGLCLDSPDVTSPEKCRYDACIEVDASFQPQGEIGVETIAGGRYACATFTGTSAEVREGWNQFLSEWLPGSRYQPDDRPAVEIYEPDFAIDEKTGAFPCLLCLPVRPA
jgi:AraC family transcriptional regulator